MKATMDNYLTYINVYLKYHKKYPFGLFIKLVHFPVQMLLSIFLWIAISTSGDLDLNYMILYYMLVNLLAYAYPFAQIAKDVQEYIMDGTIYNYLVRPIKLIVPLFSKYLSWMIIYSVVFIPALVVVVFVHQISVVQILLFILFAILGMFIEFLIWFNIGLIAFFLGRVQGIITATLALRVFLSGTLLPLSFFPSLVQKIAFYLPYRFYIFTPVDHTLSNNGLAAILIDIGLSFLWIFILLLLNKFLWDKGKVKMQTHMS